MLTKPRERRRDRLPAGRFPCPTFQRAATGANWRTNVNVLKTPEIVERDAAGARPVDANASANVQTNQPRRLRFLVELLWQQSNLLEGNKGTRKVLS